MNKIMSLLSTKRKGITTFEYILILAGIAVIILVLIGIFRPALEGQATNIADIITHAGDR